MQFAHPRLSIGQNNQAWENSVFQLLNLTTDWPHDDAKSPAQNDSATKCISNLQSPLFIHFGDGEKTCTSSYPQVLLQSHYAKSLDFVQNISPFKTDLSGNTVWPQD